MKSVAAGPLRQCLVSGNRRPRQGAEICNFGAPSPLDFLFFSSVFFCPFSMFSVQFRKWTLRCAVERRKRRRISSRLWLFRPQWSEPYVGCPPPDLPFEMKACEFELFKSCLNSFEVFFDPFSNKLKTIPTPNKNGSYGI